jgi:hypothetical protein
MMSEFKITGALKCKMGTMTFESGFKKREFVVTTEEEYPQDIKFSLIKDKCDLIEEIKENERLDVFFNIRGNEYQERFYVDLQAWKIQRLEGVSAEKPDDRTEQDKGGDEEDLPF